MYKFILFELIQLKWQKLIKLKNKYKRNRPNKTNEHEQYDNKSLQTLANTE